MVMIIDTFYTIFTNTKYEEQRFVRHALCLQYDIDHQLIALHSSSSQQNFNCLIFVIKIPNVLRPKLYW